MKPDGVICLETGTKAGIGFAVRKDLEYRWIVRCHGLKAGRKELGDYLRAQL